MSTLACMITFAYVIKHETGNPGRDVEHWAIDSDFFLPLFCELLRGEIDG